MNKLFAIFLLITFSHQVSGQNLSEQKIIDTSTYYCRNDYILINTVFEKAVEIDKDFSSKPFRNDGIERITYLLFKAKKNSRQWFHLCVYKYSNANYSAEKFKELSKVKSNNDDSVFGKGWSHSFISSDLIIKIESDCAFGESEWNSLKGLILKAIGKITKGKIIDTIDCYCGGGCN